MESSAARNKDVPDKPEIPALQVVTSDPTPGPHDPEQLPLLRMLEIVRDRVESIHASQRTVVEELRTIKIALPMQRKPLSKRAQALHILATSTRRNCLCPCCQEVPVCTDLGRLEGAEYDHFFNRNQNRVTQTWLVCGECNRRLIDSEFKAGARSAFESYQAALRPLLSRQIQMPLCEGPKD